MERNFTLLQCSQKYIEYGFSVIPIELQSGLPTLVYEEYKKRIPTNDELIQMFSSLDWDHFGIAFICGAVSGNLEAISFIGEHTILKPIMDDILSIPNLRQLSTESRQLYLYQNPVGFDILYRFDGQNSNSETLAEYVNKMGETLPSIKAKGEGDFIIVHPTKEYTLYNKHLTNPIPTSISVSERTIIKEVAKLFNEKRPFRMEQSEYGRVDAIGQVADFFNNSGDGNAFVYQYLQNELKWEKISSSIWMKHDDNDKIIYGWLDKFKRNRFLVSNATQTFVPDYIYTPFDFLLHYYKGDYVKAAKSINNILPVEYLEEILKLEKSNALLQKAYVSISEKYIDQEPYIYIKSKDEKFTIGSVNNFTVISGKAKVGKTLLLTYLASSMFNEGQIFKFGSELKDKKIVYIDTEQSRNYSTRINERLIQATNMDEETIGQRFEVFNATDCNPIGRIDIIEKKLFWDNQVRILIIDGIRDLVRNINNLEEVNQLMETMQKWKNNYPIHIIVVIHENKGNSYLRGHLGSELTNKAETNLGLTKKSNMITVCCNFSRNKEFDNLFFKIGENGILEYTNGQLTDKSKISTKSMSDEEHLKVLKGVFSTASILSYEELRKQIIIAFPNIVDLEIGVSKAKTLITYYREKGYIIKEGNGNRLSNGQNVEES